MNKPVRTLRCAIYTRVSTDSGLEQDFNSLDAQREACAAFIKSQSHEGWVGLPGLYDDGGFSGGSMERPALQRLLVEIRERRVDVVVVYKVDRLTRALSDFAKLVELFDAHGVSFVSVTQSFNTTTSMGRLTLNVLLSFAQFEREVTAERIRDKIAASKKKGIWIGGPVPLGYCVRDRKLVPEPDEAETVRTVFKLYLTSTSLLNLTGLLNARGIVTKRTVQRSGAIRGGIPFGKGALIHLLRNRTYRGELVHKGRWHKADHEPIVDLALFEAVATKLKDQRRAFWSARGPSESLLLGKLVDAVARRMSPVFSRKMGVRYRYYETHPTPLAKDRSMPRMRVPAPDLEATVLDALRDQIRGSGQINGGEGGPHSTSDPDRELIDHHLIRVMLRSDGFELTGRNAPENDDARWTISVPWLRPTRWIKREIHTGPDDNSSGKPMRSDTRQTLLVAIAKSRRWMAQIQAGRIADTERIGEVEGRSARHIRTWLPLAFVPPAIIEAVVVGEGPEARGAAGLLADLPIEWNSAS